MSELKIKDHGRDVSICETGFSFGVLFFGAIKPLLRRNYKYAIIIFVTQILLCALMYIFIKETIPLVLTCLYIVAVINILFAANYNRLYLEDLIEKGYMPRDGYEGVKLYKKGIYYSYK